MKRVWVACFGCLPALFLYASASATSIGFQPSSSGTLIGQITTFDLIVDKPINGLAAYDILVTYDPSLLNFREDRSFFPGREPSQLACPGLLRLCRNSGSLAKLEEMPGEIRLLEVSLAPAEDLIKQSARFVIAFLAFEGIALGNSDIIISPFEIVLTDRFGEPIPISDGDIRNAVAAIIVPSPSSLALLIGGLLAMVFALKASNRIEQKSAHRGPGHPRVTKGTDSRNVRSPIAVFGAARTLALISMMASVPANAGSSVGDYRYLRWWEEESFALFPLFTYTPTDHNCAEPYSQSALCPKSPFKLHIEILNDHRPEDGWMLVFRNFGSPGVQINPPYFVLYNRYQGLLRFFIFVPPRGESFTKFAIELSFGSTTKTTSLALLGPRALGLDAVQEAKKRRGYVVKQKEDIGDLKWVFADFPISYDPDIKTRGPDPTFSFFIRGIRISTIEADITGSINQILPELGTYGLPANEGLSREGDISFGNAVTAAKQAYSTYENWESMRSKVNKTAEDGVLRAYMGVTNIDSLTPEQRTEKFMERDARILNGYKPGVKESYWGDLLGVGKSTVAELVPFAGAVIGLFDFFVSGGRTVEKERPAPMSFQANLKFKGTIDLETSIANITFPVPGGNHSHIDPLQPLFLDQPLGVFALRNTPVLERREVRSDVDDCPGVREDCFDNFAHVYQVSNKLEWVVNPLSNLTVESLEATVVYGVGATGVEEELGRVRIDGTTELESLAGEQPRFRKGSYVDIRNLQYHNTYSPEFRGRQRIDPHMGPLTVLGAPVDPIVKLKVVLQRKDAPKNTQRVVIVQSYIPKILNTIQAPTWLHGSIRPIRNSLVRPSFDIFLPERPAKVGQWKSAGIGRIGWVPVYVKIENVYYWVEFTTDSRLFADKSMRSSVNFFSSPQMLFHPYAAGATSRRTIEAPGTLLPEAMRTGKLFYRLVLVSTPLPKTDDLFITPSTAHIEMRKLGDVGAVPDQCVSREDLNTLWNHILNHAPYDARLDLNNDGVVDVTDARELVTLFTKPDGSACQ